MNKNLPIILIIAVSFIVRLYSLFSYHDLWWDSSVYIGMGKYIFSLGKIGLWEANRPLIWPLILGFGWKLGFNPVFFGKMVVMLCSLGSIFLVYLIALRIFNRYVAIFSSLMLSFSYTYMRFNNILFSEIVSTFFLLLGVYYFFNEKKYSLSGTFLGIAVMTRFFHIFTVGVLVVFAFFMLYKKRRKQFLLFLSSISLPLLLFFIINFFLYRNFLYPFLLQAYMTRNTGWIFHQPLGFYLVNLFQENFLIVFSLVALFVIFRKINLNRLAVLLLGLIPFILYVLEKHKEMRLLICILPFMYIITAVGLVYFIDIFKKNKKVVFAFVLIIWILFSVQRIEFDKYDDKLDVFYDYIGGANVNEGIWISNPSFIAYSHKKADELIYYPLYYSEKAKELQDKVGSAKIVLINTCDIMPCPPEDYSCGIETEKLILLLNSTMQSRFYKEEGNCRYYIFQSEGL